MSLNNQQIMITLVGNESDMSLLTFPNSGNTYYFRSFIPVDLIEHFGGIKEFRISLKCAIKSRIGCLCMFVQSSY